MLTIEQRRKYYSKYKEKRRIWDKKYYETHKKERVEISKRYYQKIKKIVFSHYGSKCQWKGCNVSDPDMLQIDHIRGGGD
jgi:hypothetical protein